MCNESKFVECIFCSYNFDIVELVVKLMYGVGDVVDLDIDIVDYMEDMVVEFLLDFVSIVKCCSYSVFFGFDE